MTDHRAFERDNVTNERPLPGRQQSAGRDRRSHAKLADAGVDLQIAIPAGISGDRVQMGFGARDAAPLKRTLGV